MQRLKACAFSGCRPRSQMIRVVRLGADSPDLLAVPGEEGEIIALLQGDESFEGYWRRPEADAKALRDGWYFSGDTGYFDGDGDLFVTGRVDDMIISGGENISPVEIESCLSLHPAVSEVVVVGLPDERWGKIVAAFVKRRAHVDADELDRHCRGSALAAFKRPRRYVFVAAIPKSPVGKLLRRKLIAAGSRDTLRTRTWTGKPARLLRTGWTDAWEDPANPKPLQMPLQWFLTAEAQHRIFRSENENLIGMPVGQIVSRMNEIRKTEDVVRDMARECEETLALLQSMVGERV